MGSGAAATLSRRQMTSEPEKSFKCPTCARIFNKKANLKVHSRKHTGEKPYACSKPGCGRAFMWKSSVTFHEQNCQAGRKDKDPLNPPSPMSVTSKGVQKRPKTSRTNVFAGPSADGPRTPPKQTTPVSAAKRRPSRALLNRSVPTTPMTPEDLTVDPSNVRDDVILTSYMAQKDTPRTNRVDTEVMNAGFSVHAQPSSLNAAPTPVFSATFGSTPLPASSTSFGISPLPIASPFASSPLPSSGLSLLAANNTKSVLTPATSPPATPSFFGTPDGHTLPAPSTLLGEKRMQTGGGRPPVIPGSLQKHFYGLQNTHKETAPGGKPLFDLRVPSSPVPSSAKPPVYNNKVSNMPKMPIAMELDDSDDEGPGKIVGAQDAFMRTGNPFGGFAPPTRCSPLPISSPIVCPGISPMPLSPLAPFSPLPPDSPAHNAPNPVHPPLNQPNVRPTNANW